MNFTLGDLVTRKSYNNDVLFKIIEIDNNVVYLKGVDVRLMADSDISDLVKVIDKVDIYSEDRLIIKKLRDDITLDRSEFFYLPGRILHIDSDTDYLERCIKFYKDMKVEAYGLNVNENDLADTITDNLKKYKPDIVVLTGHDAYFKGKDKKYQNSTNFINAVEEARKYESSHDKLIIIAGACQSNYEELIRAGANFASSPKRINIHALDPAIIASSVALSEKNKSIDLLALLHKTKYGSDGMGGIITNGTMYVGFPR
jgi:spore coat assembly protein